MVKKKYQSKRTTIKDKNKMRKRCAEHHRKIKKQARRDSKNGVVKHQAKKKDPGIPNSWPFKQELLTEIARAKERQQEILDQRKNQTREQLRALNEHVQNGGTARTYEELMQQSAQKQADFDDKPTTETEETPAVLSATPLGQQSRRAYLKDLKKVVDSSDVILQILDARDPMGSRASKAVEDMILSRADKKMVLVLNKIDLVPKDAIRGWLTYLRRSHPTVALKAGTGADGRAKGEGALKTTSAVGMEGLMDLLKNYCRVMDQKKGSITVGVIGYPNVGKSSIINSLKRARAVGVSPRPGFTTTLQEVVLDKNIRLIDSPGVVFDDGNGDDKNEVAASVMLRNCVDADSVEDPISAVRAILQKCTQRSLLQTYCLPMFPPGDEQAFLGMIAKKYGKVTKGGLPNKELAARTVLRDWNSGKVPFYTQPPGDDEERNVETDAQVVTHFGDAFDVSKYDSEILKELQENDEMDFVAMNNCQDGGCGGCCGADTAMEDDEEDEDASNDSASDMEDDVATTKITNIVKNTQAAEAEDFDFADL